MKQYIVLMCLGLATATYGNGHKPHGHKNLSNRKGADLVRVTLQRKFLGTWIEIYGHRGELITSTAAYKRKIYIDFYDQPRGDYKIKIKKGSQVEIINYKNIFVYRSGKKTKPVILQVNYMMI